MFITKDFPVVTALVRTILQKPLAHEWSLQGFGMLRLHLLGKYRLNIWDSRYRVPNVSLIHTHPWNFESLVIAGALQNFRFTTTVEPATHSFARIVPGPGGGLVSSETIAPTCLRVCKIDRVYVGQRYAQRHDEIHLSNPIDGTITFNDRERVGEDRALVFWKRGTKWISAEPRVATVDEVLDITGNALRRIDANDSKLLVFPPCEASLVALGEEFSALQSNRF